MPTHFSVTVLDGKHGLKLTQENYAIVNNKNSLVPFQNITYTDKEGIYYSDEWCAKHLDDCLKNFDLNMKFFSTLNRKEFNTSITTFLKKHQRFRQISGLNICAGKSGYYMMVLDEYCQLYSGTTNDIMRRIRQHWSSSKAFDRLLFPIGAVDTSILSVDSFRAYDTTRIYAYITPDTYEREDNYISYFPAKFVCNRITGGKITGGLLQAIPMKKQRPLK
ncbi:MAG TPA: hypothetical protein DEB31_08450 [Clostridiales bacterium]|nr:hypothetical protein [Clostridiales bacterium]